MLIFTVPLEHGLFLGVDGRPSSEPFQFTLRTPTILDEQNIQRRVRELAAHMHTNGEPHPLAYADMMAGLDILSGGLRQTLDVALQAIMQRELEDHSTVTTLGMQYLPDAAHSRLPQRLRALHYERDALRVVASLTPDAAQLALDQDVLTGDERRFMKLVSAGVAEARLLELDLAIEVCDALCFLPHATLRQLHAEALEVSYLEDAVSAIEGSARWEILSTPMHETWQRLDTVPGWAVFGRRIVESWQKAERAALKSFTKPSSS